MQQLAPKHIYSFQAQLESQLDPLIAQAKASADVADWTPLARKHWSGSPFTKEFCRRFSTSRRANDDLWYEALQNYAQLTEPQMVLLRESWKALRSESMSVAKSAFTVEQLKVWAQGPLSQAVRVFHNAPPDLKRDAARQLAAKNWESNPAFH